MPTCQDQLRIGVSLPDRLGRSVLYRYLTAIDDVEAITELLHEAYAPLALAGMRFVASYQTPDITQRRMARGETIVAESDGRIAGLVTLASVDATRGTPFYDRPDVASFGQFAVNPTSQRRGIGSMLIQLIERRAAELGAAELALDTSEHAAHLIAFYQARGYRLIEYCQWVVTTYRSVVLAKRLT